MTVLNISANPGTDIWRKPPHTNVFNAPNTPPSSGKLANFISAQASFSFPWSEQYDQAGLLLTFHPSSSSTTPCDPPTPPPKWIKTGIEFYNNQPMLSTVSCERWADWSVTPLPLSSTMSSESEIWTTISIERAGDEHGTSLWVYLVGDDGNKTPLREICWVYGTDASGGGGYDPAVWSLEVSAMAARPAKTAGETLEVKVQGLEVKWES